MGDRSDQLFERALKVIPGGVNSPVRAFGSVGGTPWFADRAEGARIWDVDGNEYLDYVQSYGASILGHAHPAVIDAIRAAAARGTTFGAPTENEVRLAEEVVARIDGCDELRLVSSGTEAGMSAVRLARGATGRDRVIKFAGCYHGHSDGLLAESGTGVATLGLAGSAGVPAGAVAETMVVPYNVVPEVGNDVACVIVEPVAANMGLVAPVPGFLEGLRAACDAAGALLIFDEVITGFRIAGAGAQEVFGVRPDLWCFGKVVGGGLPLAAFGGRRDVMEQLAPPGPVYQAGTLSGNPLATAAGLAVLARLEERKYEALERMATALADGLRAAVADAGLPVQVPRVATLVGVFFSDQPVANYDDARAACANGLYTGFFHGMRERGISVAPGPYEVLFTSLAHTASDIDRTIEAAAGAAKQVASTA